MSKLLRPLSAREVEVALLAARGWSYKRIGYALGIKADSARLHVYRIARKLDNPDRLCQIMLVVLWAHDNIAHLERLRSQNELATPRAA